MRQRKSGTAALPVILTVCLQAINASTAFAQVQAKYQYTLSNFAGQLRYDWVRLTVDPARDEIYVIYQNLIRIFNPSGMETFSFGDDLDLGQIVDAAVDDRGDIIVLSYRDSRPSLTRCNFRGVPVAPIEIRNVPAGVVFKANRMILRNGLFYFASLGSSSVIVADADGEFRKYIELLPLVEAREKDKSGSEMNGFTVDQDGNILFTVATFFKVYRFSTDGKLESFGRSGSTPGRFGVIAGIATDSHGNLLVTDKLKCVVMVFDKEFNFVTEFGYRGARPENLIVPDDIAIDRKDRVYVSQGRRRGVSVFALTQN